MRTSLSPSWERKKPCLHRGERLTVRIFEQMSGYASQANPTYPPLHTPVGLISLKGVIRQQAQRLSNFHTQPLPIIINPKLLELIA